MFLDFLKKLSKSDSFFKNVKNMVKMHKNVCQILTPFLIDFFVFFHDFKNGGGRKSAKNDQNPLKGHLRPSSFWGLFKLIRP